MAIARWSGVDLMANISVAAQERERTQRQTMTPSEIAWLKQKRSEEEAGHRARQLVAEATAHRRETPN